VAPDFWRTPLRTHRQPAIVSDILLDDRWRFILAEIPGATNVVFDDPSWTSIALPHTWNNLDGQDGGGTYFQGIGWYRRHRTVDGS